MHGGEGGRWAPARARALVSKRGCGGGQLEASPRDVAPGVNSALLWATRTVRVLVQTSSWAAWGRAGGAHIATRLEHQPPCTELVVEHD